MKNIFQSFVWCLVLVSLFSCRSYKELIYFRDAQPDSLITVLPPEATEYLIQPGDILYISIKTLNEDVNRIFNPAGGLGSQSSSSSAENVNTPSGSYMNGYEVDKDGFLNLPFMGKMRVAGFKQNEIEEIVQQKANEFLKDAIVKVKLVNYKVIILGEVGSPGVYYYFGNHLTVLEALAMAGGNSDQANLKKVMVFRNTDTGKKSFMLDLSSVMAYTSEAYYLQPDDYVFLSPDRIKSIQLTAPAYSFFFGIVSFTISILALIL
ncbi:MAG TPA: polysaccharide biosynthesis/export family protein [Bacteroidales bacterium]|nr:polysaccharide biosynthesis/export family protein [Bacteroidales bacterium]